MGQKIITKNIVIVGGGTAGWLTALYAKKQLPNDNITVIESAEIGILGAGEGSTPMLLQFLDDLGISISDLVRDCDATIKNGIKFTNWNNDNSFYYHGFYNDSTKGNAFYSHIIPSPARVGSLALNNSLKEVDFPEKVSEKLDTYFQVWVADGWICWFYKNIELLENKRVFSAMWINLKMCQENEIIFDWLYKKNKYVHLWEDFFFTLKWLSSWIKNCILTQFKIMHPHWKKWWNSTSRTLEMEKLSYEMLLEEFPDSLSFKKEYDNSWNVWEDENWKCRYKANFKWTKTYLNSLKK